MRQQARMIWGGMAVLALVVAGVPSDAAGGPLLGRSKTASNLARGLDRGATAVGGALLGSAPFPSLETAALPSLPAWPVLPVRVPSPAKEALGVVFGTVHQLDAMGSGPASTFANAMPSSFPALAAPSVPTPESLTSRLPSFPPSPPTVEGLASAAPVLFDAPGFPALPAVPAP